LTWTRRNLFDSWHVTSGGGPGWTRCNADTRGHEHQSASDPFGPYCSPCVRALLADLRQQVASLDQDLADKEAGERWHNGPRDPEPDPKAG